MTETILENSKKFDILFIWELSWSIIWQILSFSTEKEDFIGASYHLS